MFSGSNSCILTNAPARFLLAQLHLGSLAKKQNRRDVRMSLQDLPKELSGTYDEIHTTNLEPGRGRCIPSKKGVVIDILFSPIIDTCRASTRVGHHTRRVLS